MDIIIDIFVRMTPCVFQVVAGQPVSCCVSTAHLSGDLLVAAAADTPAGALQPDSALRRHHVVYVHTHPRLLYTFCQHRHRRPARTQRTQRRTGRSSLLQ